MKIRNGFVSNSSSSSFIIERVNFGDSKKLLISKDVEKKIKKFGFEKTFACTPYQIGLDGWKYDYLTFQQWKDKLTFGKDKSDKELRDLFKGTNNLYNWGYDIICNQDNVLEFLFKNKIPFKATIHYEQHYIVYDGKNNVIVAHNYGNLLDMNYTLEMLKKLQPIVKVTVKQFWKRNWYDI